MQKSTRICAKLNAERLKNCRHLAKTTRRVEKISRRVVEIKSEKNLLMRRCDKYQSQRRMILSFSPSHKFLKRAKNDALRFNTFSAYIQHICRRKHLFVSLFKSDADAHVTHRIYSYRDPRKMAITHSSKWIIAISDCVATDGMNLRRCL